MKRFFLIFALITISTFPVASSAFEVSDCDYGKEEAMCSCIKYNTGEEIYVDIRKEESSTACQSACKELQSEGISNSAISSFSLECIIQNKREVINQGNLTSIVDDILAEHDAEADAKNAPLPFKLNVKIPGLELKQATINGDTIEVSYLSQYITAIYKWLLYAASLLAVVFIMIGGLQWAMARGNPSAIEQAKKRIGGAVVGIIILLLATSVLSIIDPRLTNLKSLNITKLDPYFEPDMLPEEEEFLSKYSPTMIPDPGIGVRAEGEHIKNVSGTTPNVTEEVLTSLQAAANEFYAETETNIQFTSGIRTLKRQSELFYDQCIKNGGKCSQPTCQPSTEGLTYTNGKWNLSGDLSVASNRSEVLEYMVDNANPAKCKHTTGIAVDVWCSGSTTSKYDIACMQTLMDTMLNNGFCRLKSEVWHFELASKSTAPCYTQSTTSYTSGGETVTPDSDCKQWNSRKNTCVKK